MTPFSPGNALVEQRKIVEYLLNGNHPDNGGKAAFFLALGFTPDRWQIFADALRKLAQAAAVVESVESPHGIKYIVDGALEGSRGRTARVRTVWILDGGADAPRLVTAYPEKERRL